MFPITTRAQTAGHIFLQVEAHGEAWYVNPLDQRRYYLGRPKHALAILQALGNPYASHTPEEAWQVIIDQGIGISNQQFLSIQPNIEIIALHQRSNKPDAKEFVTIKNLGQLPQSLRGWSVTDGGNNQLRIKKNTLLLPGQTKRFYNRTAVNVWGAVNGEVKLFTKQQSLVDEYSYNYAGRVMLNVPFTVQAPLNNWGAPYNEACEEAILVMLSHYYLGTVLTPDQADQEIINIVNWERQAYGFDEDTSAELTARTARDYIGIPAVVSDDVSVIHIKQLLNAGKPVIVPVLGKALNNPHYKNGGPYYHMIIIIGYDGDNFITHDPGTHYGEQYRYNADLLVSAIHDLTNPETDLAKGIPKLIVVGE
jgi:hypothetical protein